MSGSYRARDCAAKFSGVSRCDSLSSNTAAGWVLTARNPWVSGSEGGEESFLRWVRASADSSEDLLVPIGDDGAVVRWLGDPRLVAVADALAEGSHFRSDDLPESIGRKALAVNLSDLAAMGARPRFALATAALPRGFAAELPRRLTAGLRALAAEFDCPLIGGDTITHDGGLVLSVTALGSLIGEPVTRAGARPGDEIVVTGPLGGSLGGRHLLFVPRVAEAELLVRNGPPSAMIDVSDGFLLDLHRLADASEVGFEVDLRAVPVHEDARRFGSDSLRRALSDGEDFELIATLAPDALARASAAGLRLSRVGRIVQSGRRTLFDESGERPAPRWGFEHR